MNEKDVEKFQSRRMKDDENISVSAGVLRGKRRCEERRADEIITANGQHEETVYHPADAVRRPDRRWS